MQQDSKLVQVDLQDLGYETCGRSENEAEREDTSSPGNRHDSNPPLEGGEEHRKKYFRSYILHLVI